MRIELNTAERWGAVVLLSSIQEGSFKELKQAKEGLKVLKFSDKEKENLEMKFNGNILTWNTKKGEKKQEFTVDDALTPLMKERMKALSENKRLRGELFDIAEKLGVE